MKIETIKEGQVFYECPQGENYECTATSDAYRHDGGWKVDVLDKDGEESSLYVRDGFAHYVRLYESPQYVSNVKGAMGFVIS